VNADPDPALKMNADPCRSGSWIYFKHKKFSNSKNNVKFK
jgi:hypothetical protein